MLKQSNGFLTPFTQHRQHNFNSTHIESSFLPLSQEKETLILSLLVTRLSNNQ